MTIAAATDDRFPLGIVVIYIGKKQASGNEPMRAGLVGGYVVCVCVCLNSERISMTSFV